LFGYFLFEKRVGQDRQAKQDGKKKAHSAEIMVTSNMSNNFKGA
jgi:hypothetical protein